MSGLFISHHLLAMQMRGLWRFAHIQDIEVFTEFTTEPELDSLFASGVFIGCLWSVANMGSNKRFGSPSRTTTADQGPGSVAPRAELYRNFKRHLISKAKTLLHGSDGKRLNHLARVLPIMMQNVKLSARGVTMPENMSP